MYFCVNGFEVGVNDSIFSGNEQQKVYCFSKAKCMHSMVFVLRTFKREFNFFKSGLFVYKVFA